MRERKLLCLCLAALLTLSGCGGEPEAPSPAPTSAQTAAPSATPEPDPEPTPVQEEGVNPLTGLPMAEDQMARRPMAIMLNNLRQALPQLGNAQADIIYEVLAEGGITRMLGVYQSVDGVGTIGSVRSARTYYLELAMGHDAIYLHAGGSPDAYAKLREWDITALDCVNGPYEGTLFWRDQQRRENNGYEHSVVTSGETIQTLLPTYHIRLDHEEGYVYPQTFQDDGTPAGGETAETITVPFSRYKTGVFRYDADSGTYLVEEYGQAYIDGNSGEQVAATNVLILFTACDLIAGDEAGRITVELTGGDGYYACGGQLIPIQWSKADRNSPLVYTTADGEPLSLGRGKSYVNIVPLNTGVTWQ